MGIFRVNGQALLQGQERGAGANESLPQSNAGSQDWPQTLASERSPRRKFGRQSTARKISRTSAKTKPAGMRRVRKSRPIREPTSLLPRALLVAISLQALAALVLVHFQTSFLFQIAHVMFYLAKGHRAAPAWTCKVEFTAKAL